MAVRTSASLLQAGIAVGVAGWAVAGLALGQRYRVRTYEEVDGLPSARIADMAQDPSGALWIAAGHRLIRYDGVNWTSIGGGKGLPRVDQARVLVERTGVVWVLPGFPRNEVVRGRPGEWETLPILPGIHQEADEWSGAALLEGPGGTTLVTFVRGLGGFAAEDGVWRPLPALTALGHRAVRDLEVSGGWTYVAADSGLYRLDPALESLERVDGVGEGPVLGMTTDPRTGELWAVGEDWIGVTEGADLTRLDVEFELRILTPNRFAGPVIDHAGGIYFGHTRSLLRLDPETGVTPLGRSNGLLKEGATSLFVDREGNVWVGSAGGLSKLVSLRLAGFDIGHGLLESEVTTILERSSGERVLGHPYGLTFLGPPHRTLEVDVPQEARARILELEEDGEGRIWIAAQGKGIGLLEGDDRVRWDDLDPSVPEGTNSVHVDGLGRIWVSESRTLFRKDGPDEPFRRIDVGNVTRPLVYFRKIFEAGGGRVLVATSTCGVYVVDDGLVEVWASGEDPSLNDVFAVAEDGEGTTWLGTRGGLARLDGDRIVPAAPRVPDLGRAIFSLHAEGGELWCGTDDGLRIWDGESWDRLSVEEGLIARETNRDALLRDRDGRIWIGTEGGLSVYRPELDFGPRPAPVLSLLEVVADGEGHDPGGPLSMDAGSGGLLFRFLGTYLTDEDAVEFRYRLLPDEDAWSPAQRLTTQSVRYPRLPPGEYRFEVQARGPGGPWSEVATTGAIRLVGPVWTRPWALAVFGLLAAAAGTVLVRTLARLRYARELEEEVARRLAEVRALEAENERARKLESLGVLAGGLAHDFNNLLTVMTGAFSLLESEPDLDPDLRALSTDGLAATERARTLTQQLLTFSRGGAPLLRAASMEDLVRESARFVLAGSDVALELDLEPDLDPVLADPGQISQVLSNLLLNAKQASRPGATVRDPVEVGRRLESLGFEAPLGHEEACLGEGRVGTVPVLDQGDLARRAHGLLGAVELAGVEREPGVLHQEARCHARILHALEQLGRQVLGGAQLAGVDQGRDRQARGSEGLLLVAGGSAEQSERGRGALGVPGLRPRPDQQLQRGLAQLGRGPAQTLEPVERARRRREVTGLVAAPGHAVARLGRELALRETLEQLLVALARITGPIGLGQELRQLERGLGSELAVGRIREQALEPPDALLSTFDARQPEQGFGAPSSVGVSLDVLLPGLGGRAGTPGGLEATPQHEARLGHLRGRAISADGLVEEHCGALRVLQLPAAPRAARQGARRDRVLGLGLEDLGEGALGRLELALAEQRFGQDQARVGRVLALGVALEQRPRETDRFCRLLRVEGLQGGGVQGVLRSRAGEGGGRLGAAAHGRQGGTAGDVQPVLQLLGRVGTQGAVDAVEGRFGVAGLELGLRAPVERLGAASDAPVAQGFERAFRLAGPHPLHAPVQDGLGRVAPFGEGLQQLLELLRGGAVVPLIGQCEGRAAQRGVVEGPPAHAPVRVDRFRRTPRGELSLAEQEAHLPRQLVGAPAVQEARGALDRAVVALQAERTPRQPVGRVPGILPVVAALPQHALVALLGLFELLHPEASVREEEPRRGLEVVLVELEHAPEGDRCLARMVLEQLALPQPEEDLSFELEVAPSGQLLQLRGRLGELVQLEQRGRQAVAGQVGLRVAPVPAQERPRLAHRQVVEALVRQPHEVLVLLVRFVETCLNGWARNDTECEREGGVTQETHRATPLWWTCGTTIQLPR